jgi:hypothetical protein
MYSEPFADPHITPPSCQQLRAARDRCLSERAVMTVRSMHAIGRALRFGTCWVLAGKLAMAQQNALWTGCRSLPHRSIGSGAAPSLKAWRWAQGGSKDF